VDAAPAGGLVPIEDLERSASTIKEIGRPLQTFSRFALA
jgi:hypothetical protein